MDFVEFSGKTVEDAITEATVSLGITSDNLKYEVVDNGSQGILGIGKKPAIIRVVKNKSIEEIAKDFLSDVFNSMNVVVETSIKYLEDEKTLSINLEGEEMGLLIGKRGQTIDSLQYLVSLVINKESEEYIRVKLDTENYRERRKKTLEELAKNIAFKVKRTKRSVSLEPMNPYERRIIHSALQNDRFVTTRSEGSEPYRHIVVVLKRNN
ncbi:spoIIIJ-associated protein [Lachnospiraceae bacterium RM5]|nr:spoIIIJ-associated protein [Lachnospiraceae bacterium RM5]